MIADYSIISLQNKLVQSEIQKLQADLEYHEQKVRLINSELNQKNRILSNLLRSAERFRRLRRNTSNDD